VPWKLRPMDRTDLFAVRLRRYTQAAETECPNSKYGHNAFNDTDEVRERPGYAFEGDASGTLPHDHPDWPTHCTCGYEFQPEDEWQVHQERLYRLHDTGELVTTRTAPVGAAWYFPWKRESGFVSLEYKRDWEGKREPISVKLPPGEPWNEWCIDGPANNKEPGWVVTGSLEEGNLTASPSIAHGKWYHGFLQNGILTEDVEGRTFPDLPRTA
jgi:hypothetical protein